MRNYHPPSWSKQARKLAHRFLLWDNKDVALKALENSYRHPLIVQRAVKNFMRNKNKKVDN